MSDPSLPQIPRNTLFISKATPGDDAFALWLAPRLEAEGYYVFADILSLDAGDRWRRKLTETLQHRANKMLLCCSDESLARNGVDEEITIAESLSKQLKDPNFIIPLRLKPFTPIFGIAGLQYVDFEPGWAPGLVKLLESLNRQGILKANSDRQISPEWEQYQKRLQVVLDPTPEPLTSNWIRLASAPDDIKFFSPEGAINHGTMAQEARSFEYPLVSHNRGFFGFCSVEDMNAHFTGTGRFSVTATCSLSEFLANGLADPEIDEQTAKNYVIQIMRLAWERYCLKQGLLKREFSSSLSFHVSEPLAKIGQRIAWGKQGSRRSSMLRNISRKKVWEFGMSAAPNLYPFPHYRLKSRVLFSDLEENETRGETIESTEAQHRLRRSVCSGWRNPAWHGRLMAYLEILAPDAAEIKLPVGSNMALSVDATPIMITSPVSTRQRHELGPDDEELDESTLPPTNDNEDEEGP